MNVYLADGSVAVVDDVDFERVSPHNWHLMKSSTVNYAHSKVAGWMHRFITGVAEGTFVDHKNLDGLDNRRENLRLCTHSQNCQNRRRRSNSQSRFKGVWEYKKYGTWRTQIRVGGRLIIVGRFATEEEAAKAYDWAASLYFGEFSRLDFPGEPLQEPRPLTRKNNWRKRT